MDKMKAYSKGLHEAASRYITKRNNLKKEISKMKNEVTRLQEQNDGLENDNDKKRWDYKADCRKHVTTSKIF